MRFTNSHQSDTIILDKVTQTQRIQPTINKRATYIIYCHLQNKTVVSNHCVADYFRFRKHTSRN
ncbi:Uncharacterised protein [Vibrio cholerae]|nr:Uncharacterised protein [Vibrio cholerae]